jgi:hypothetical protein
MTQKSDTPRARVIYQLNSGTRPEVSAAKIRDTFGLDFAIALAAELMRA